MQVTDNRAANRFELPVSASPDGGPGAAPDTGIARLEYRRTPTALVLLHTEVPESARGRGLGGRLVEAALRSAEADGLTVTPLCPFARAHIEATAGSGASNP